MVSVSISIPEPLDEFVAEQVAKRGYQTPSDYISELIREAREREEEERLEALLTQGLDSGPRIEFTPEYWRRKQAEFVSRHQLPTERS